MPGNDSAGLGIWDLQQWYPWYRSQWGSLGNRFVVFLRQQWLWTSLKLSLPEKIAATPWSWYGFCWRNVELEYMGHKPDINSESPGDWMACLGNCDLCMPERSCWERLGGRFTELRISFNRGSKYTFLGTSRKPCSFATERPSFFWLMLLPSYPWSLRVPLQVQNWDFSPPKLKEDEVVTVTNLASCIWLADVRVFGGCFFAHKV